MQYWLMKSEPSAYSWQEFLEDGETYWDGVRNYQARNNMMKMKIGDRVFFYHSNVTPGYVCKAIVGIAEVIKEHYPDHTDPSGKFEMVDIRPVEELPNPVKLDVIKQTPGLEEMALLKQSRLSVSPVTEKEWKIICKMGRVKG